MGRTQLRKFVAALLAAVAGAVGVGAASAAAPAAPARVLVAMDPADEGAGLLPIMVSSRELAVLLNGPAMVMPSLDLKDAMRASRTQENDAIVAPAHVTASAIAHGYELVAISGGQARFVLVGEAGIPSVAALKDRAVHFPLEDSLRSYVGRSLLSASGLPLRAVRVRYAESSLAGLMAIGGQMIHATVAEEGEWQKWDAAHPGKTKVLATSGGLPAGYGVTVRASASPAVKKAVVQWVTTTNNILPGVKRFRASDNAAPFEAVASLGIFTPPDLPGVKRVTAAEAAALASRGAQLVDVRTEREFKARHARGAVLLPYVEKSLKEPQFDASVDTFAGLGTLPKDRAVVFLCNGAECWKSYKASSAARAAGFKEVYWLRGGLPEWVKSDLPTEP